jgi:hypothetical protein
MSLAPENTPHEALLQQHLEEERRKALGPPPGGPVRLYVDPKKKQSASEIHRDRCARFLKEGNRRIRQAATVEEAWNERTKMLKEYESLCQDGPSSSDEELEMESPFQPVALVDYLTPKTKGLTKPVMNSMTTGGTMSETDDDMDLADGKSTGLSDDEVEDVSEKELLTQESKKYSAMLGCEKIYRDSNNSMVVLLSMCIGLTNKDGRLIADTDSDELYKKFLEKVFVPKAPNLKEEAKRRMESLGQKFRMKSALRPAVLEWLKANPITDEDDVAFLLKEEANLYQALKELQEELQVRERHKLENSSWRGMNPWLRLYCILGEDEVKVSLSYTSRVMRRDELDARNSEQAPEDVNSVIARYYNDPNKVYTTEALPHWHSLFAEPIVLCFQEMPGGPITPELAKSKVAESRAKLVQVRRIRCPSCAL